MYICLCNGHRDRELRELASRGVSCVREAYRQLGGDPVCGRCLDFAQDVLDRGCQAATGPGNSVAPTHSTPAQSSILGPEAGGPAEMAR